MFPIRVNSTLVCIQKCQSREYVFVSGRVLLRWRRLKALKRKMTKLLLILSLADPVVAESKHFVPLTLAQPLDQALLSVFRRV